MVASQVDNKQQQQQPIDRRFKMISLGFFPVNRCSCLFVVMLIVHVILGLITCKHHVSSESVGEIVRD